MLNVTWERKDLSFNNQGFLSNPSMVIIALDRDRNWDKVVFFFNVIAASVDVSMETSTWGREVVFHQSWSGFLENRNPDQLETKTC